MIIGFGGYPHSGKDTCAAYLIKEYGFERKAFADPVKKGIAELLGIEFWQVDELKNNIDAEVSLSIKKLQLVETAHRMADATFTYNNDLLTVKQMRDFIIAYAESIKSVFGHDFWVDRTLPVGGFYAGRKIAIPDVRFANESDRIHSLGGVVIRLERPETQSEYHDGRGHNIDADFTLNNDGSIEDLYEQLDNLLTTIPDKNESATR